MQETLTGSETMGMQANEILPTIEQKNFENFLKRMGRRAENTKRICSYSIRLLTSFLQKAHPDDTIPIITKVDPCDLLDSFVGWLTDQKYSSNSVLQTVALTKKWLRYHGVKVHNEDLRERIELPKAEEALDDPLTKNQIRQILTRMDFQTQNHMLLLSCSGVRPIDIPSIQHTDFKWDEHPVRLIVPAKGKTKRGWETFITDELAERIKNNTDFFKPKTSQDSKNLTIRFWYHIKKYHPEMRTINKSNRSWRGNRGKIHLYSLKKFFFSQVTAELGDTVAHAWCGRKSYLSNYLRLPLEDRQKLYLKVIPRLAIFSEPEKPKTEDSLRGRLKAKGLTDELIDQVLEGLVLN